MLESPLHSHLLPLTSEEQEVVALLDAIRQKLPNPHTVLWAVKQTNEELIFSGNTMLDFNARTRLALEDLFEKIGIRIEFTYYPARSEGEGGIPVGIITLTHPIPLLTGVIELCK